MTGGEKWNELCLAYSLDPDKTSTEDLDGKIKREGVAHAIYTINQVLTEMARKLRQKDAEAKPPDDVIH